jgi:hypothetical protein
MDMTTNPLSYYITCIKAILFMSLIFTSLPSHATKTSPTIAVKAEQFIQKSGLIYTIESFPKNFNYGLQVAQDQGAHIPPDVLKNIEVSAKQAFDPQVIKPIVIEAIIRVLGEKHMDAWLAFYHTPLGEKVVVADQKWSSEEVQKEVMQNMTQILENASENTGRFALLQSIVDISQVIESATNIAIQTQVAMDWAAIQTHPQIGGKPSFEEVLDLLNKQRFAIQGQIAQNVLAMTAFVYQPFTQSELQGLLKQMHSNAGKAVYVDLIGVLNEIMLSRIQVFGDILMRRLSPAT